MKHSYNTSATPTTQYGDFAANVQISTLRHGNTHTYSYTNVNIYSNIYYYPYDYSDTFYTPYSLIHFTRTPTPIVHSLVPTRYT